MPTIKRFAQARRAASHVANINNQLLDGATNFKVVLDKFDALSGANKTTFDDGLTAIGVTPADFDTLVTDILGVITGIQANLTPIPENL